MAAQFCKRSNTAYVATIVATPYVWISIQDKFVIYDGIENSKHYAIDSKNNDTLNYFDNNGDIVSYGKLRDSFYSVTQSGTELSLQ